jgi:phospholipid/cholesterol/gamma-HCH transport system substrate-binding protein
MSARPNYFKIGVFVIIGVLLIVTGLIMFGAGLFSQPKIYFETYFEGSVSGLAEGATVEDRGVKIGRVEKIAFVVSEYDLKPGTPEFRKFQSYVFVKCSMELPPFATKVTDVRERLESAGERGYRLRLASNLLTGQAIVEGKFLDPARYPPLAVPWKPKYPYIPSAPGEITTMMNSVSAILRKLEDVNIPAVTRQANDLLVELRQTNRELQEVLGDPNFKQIPGNLAHAVARTNLAIARLDAAMAGTRPEIEQVVSNMRDVSANLRDLSADLKSNPSDLIFSKPPSKQEEFK